MTHHNDSMATISYPPAVHMVNAPAPPPYSETIGTTTMKNNHMQPAYGQPTMLDPNCSLCSPSIPTYHQHPDDFYSNVSAQPPYPPYASAADPMSQQCHPAFIIYTESIPDEEKKCCCCNRDKCVIVSKRIMVVLTFLLLVLTILRIILFLTY